MGVYLNRYNRLACIFTIVTGMLLLLPAPSGNAQYPVLHNLKPKEIRLVLHTARVLDAKSLRVRALQILRASGTLVEEQVGPTDENVPLLELTIDFYDLGKDGDFPQLGKTCPGKFLYHRKLELWEDATVERLPSFRFRALTWSRTIGAPIIVDSPIPEQLNNDAERLLKDFAADFSQGNP